VFVEYVNDNVTDEAIKRKLVNMKTGTNVAIVKIGKDYCLSIHTGLVQPQANPLFIKYPLYEDALKNYEKIKAKCCKKAETVIIGSK